MPDCGTFRVPGAPSLVWGRNGADMMPPPAAAVQPPAQTGGLAAFAFRPEVVSSGAVAAGAIQITAGSREIDSTLAGAGAPERDGGALSSAWMTPNSGTIGGESPINVRSRGRFQHGTCG